MYGKTISFPVVETIHPRNNKFVTGVRIKVISDSKCTDIPDVD